LSFLFSVSDVVLDVLFPEETPLAVDVFESIDVRDLAIGLNQYINLLPFL
jgi:hypothetical protein